MDDDKSIIQNAIKVQMQSTYRTDYSGMQLGTQPPIRTHKYVPFWREQVKYNTDTESRFNYQDNKQINLLKNNTTRYGCNINKNIPAIGGSPNCNSL